MAGVQANPHRQGHPIHDLPQLPELPAELRALPGHGLQQHRGPLLRPQHRIERLRDLADTRLRTLARVAARVEIVIVPRQVLQPVQVIRHGLDGKLPGPGLLGAGIDGIRRVGHQRPEAVIRQQLPQRRRIGGVHGPGPAAPGIPGEELKRIGPQGQRRPAHSQKALRCRQVASCVQHPAAPLHSRRAAQSTLPFSRVMTP